jgi:hypothetical protein
MNPYKSAWSSKPTGAAARPPLRTIAELAEEFGVPTHVLGRVLKLPGAPAPVINNRSKAVLNRTTWFNPAQVRQFWKECKQ